MTTKSSNPAGNLADEPFVALASLQGVGRAFALAREGNLISAIKYIEAANPDLSREQAKEIVRSFGFSGPQRWPEPENQPGRVTHSIRCL